MNVLYIVSLLMLNVFAEEVYRQKRDESKEKSIDAVEDTKGVGLRDNKQARGCIATELFGPYLLGTATCYRYVRLQAAADTSSNMKQSKQRTGYPIRRVVPYPKYKPAGKIGYNNIAIVEGNGSYLYPNVAAKVARIQACDNALIQGENIPNLFCVKLARCYPDFYLQGLPASRNGQLKGILLNARCSGSAMHLVYLAISPYIRWITSQMRKTRFSIGACN